MSLPPTEPPLLDAALRFDTIPVSGRSLDVAATESQRSRIAERLGIVSVENLAAALKATAFRGGVRVTGRLEAAVTQACVVTFDPVPETISEPLDRIFLPGGGDTGESRSGEVFVDLENDDLPDHFEGPEVDFAEYLVETLALALDPYPRASGAEIADDGPLSGDEEPRSPFAGLQSLKPEKD